MTYLSMELLARERQKSLRDEAEQNRLRRLADGPSRRTNRPFSRLPIPYLRRG